MCSKCVRFRIRNKDYRFCPYCGELLDRVIIQTKSSEKNNSLPKTVCVGKKTADLMTLWDDIVAQYWGYEKDITDKK